MSLGVLGGMATPGAVGGVFGCVIYKLTISQTMTRTSHHSCCSAREDFVLCHFEAHWEVLF